MIDVFPKNCAAFRSSSIINYLYCVWNFAHPAIRKYHWILLGDEDTEATQFRNKNQEWKKKVEKGAGL